MRASPPVLIRVNVSRMKTRTADPVSLSDEQLLRYSRHILLPQIDIAGQQKLLAARVLLIGLGGLGSPAAIYLAASGIGHLTIADGDKVDLTNLQRQIVHTTNAVGETKTESALRTLRAINPEIDIVAVPRWLDENALREHIQNVDVVVDSSDNFATRYAVNRACVETRVPLVSGAVIRFDGQISVFVPGGPCYACLFKETNEADELCSQLGVLAPVAGIVGCIQATETLKLLLEIGESLVGKLLILDARTMEWRTLKFKRDPACPVCSTH